MTTKPIVGDPLEIWTRRRAVRRQPRISRADIAAAAVRVADEEGFGALSMRRIAVELDVGTMTLYHYVSTKDELLTLVVDTVVGEMVLPAAEAVPVTWREAMTVIAQRMHDSHLRHPWVLDITDDPGVGPNSVLHFDQSLQAASSVSSELRDQLDLVAAVQEYVFGYCMRFRNNFEEHDARADNEMLGYVAGLVATGHYPYLRSLVDRFGLETAWSHVHDHSRDPDRFERNLARVLDGFERNLLHLPDQRG